MHYAKLPATPVFNPSTKRYELGAESMQFLLNENDWKLGLYTNILHIYIFHSCTETPAHEEPIVHFVMFVPRAKYSPLRIRSYGGRVSNSYIVPRWGGVVIMDTFAKNHSSKRELHLSVQDLQPYMEIVVGQIRGLLGVPQLGSNIVRVWAPTGLSDWELDALVNTRFSHYLSKAIHSLTTLSSVAQKMPNVLVMESIAIHANEALAHVHLAMNMSCEGLVEPSIMLQHAKRGFEYAEQAFFHPSMLSLLYFPDSQKLMVYLPLVGPIVVVVLLGLIREFKRKRQPQQ